MTLLQALSRINYVLRGTDDDAPAIGDDEALYWTDTLNRVIQELYQDTSRNWSTTYAVNSLGTITASAAPAYNLDTTFLAPSDVVYVITTGGERIEFKIIKPEERTSSKQEVFVAGNNPEVLYFSNEILATDEIVGGTLYMPGYYMPADVSGESDVLPLPDPNWGVMAVASELAFADIIYEDKAADLTAKKNALYRQMARKNKSGTYNNPRVAPTNLPRIRGY